MAEATRSSFAPPHSGVSWPWFLLSQFLYGIDQAQPYKYGWLSYDDIVYLPTAHAHGVSGSMQR